jgi:hypothetical protein
MEPELTGAQLERQDIVDNYIFELLQELAPLGLVLGRDIELIGEVRDVIQDEFIKRGWCTEQEFYPYIVEEHHAIE